MTRTRKGAGVLHGRHLVSWLPSQPGPTHSVFDVIAALAMEGAAAGPIAMLGFAAGGTVAPLRALGFDGAVRAVDLDTRPVGAFREVAGSWAGDVTVDERDALEWIRSRRGRYGAVIEDLSMAIPGDVTKPPVSYGPLPEAVAARVAEGGVAVFNLLPVAGLSMTALATRVCAPFADARVISLRDYDNWFVLVSHGRLTSSVRLRGRLNARLYSIGSRMARTLSVRRHRK